MIVGGIGLFSISDITIQGNYIGTDITGTKALVPVQTIRAGTLYSPDWGPYPWGWLPEEA